MPVDNDTRGWVLTVLSGIGMQPAFVHDQGLALTTCPSMYTRRIDNLR